MHQDLPTITEGEMDVFKDIINSPIALIHTESLEFLQAQEEKPKENKISNFSQEQVAQPKVHQSYFNWLNRQFQEDSIQFHYFVTGELTGAYNTISKHLPYIYGWQSNEDDQEGKDRAQLYLGLVNSVINMGAAIIQVLMYFFQNLIGRRTWLRISTLLIIVGTLFALFKSTPCLIFGLKTYIKFKILGRILQGFAAGISTTISAVFIVEYIPVEYRSQLVLSGQIFFRMGLTIQYSLGYGLPDEYENTTSQYWRFMIAFPLIFSVIHQFILAFLVKYDTPTYTYMKTKGNQEATQQALRLIYNEERVQKEYKTLVLTLPINDQKDTKAITLSILWKDYKIQLFSALIISACFHFGMTFPILIFSNKILQVHHSKSTATFITTLVPLFDFFGLFPSIFLVRRFGINKLVFISGFCTMTFLLCFSILGYTELYSVQKFFLWLIRWAFSSGIPLSIFSYAPQILPFIGNTILFSSMYIIGFIITQFYLPLSDALGGHEGAALFFAIGLFVILIVLGPCGLMIDIRGLTKEQINQRFTHFKWFHKTPHIIVTQEIEKDKL